MAISNQTMADTIEVIRREQLERVRRRVGTAAPAHVVSEEQLHQTVHALREEEILRVWSHPAFRQVCRRMAEAGLPGAASNDILTHAVRDVGKMAAATWALYLDVTPGGLTRSRFDAFSEIAGTGSRNWSYGLLTYLRFLGYIEPGGATTDLRERRYRPTPRMRDAIRRHFAQQLRIVTAIAPETGPFADRIEQDDAAFAAFMGQVGEGLLVLGLLHRFNPGPTLDMFSRRRSGMVILWSLLLAAPQSAAWPAPDAFPISLTALARRTGVSRMHLLRCLRDAEEAGMLALDGSGSVRIRRLLHVEVTTFIALQVICLDWAVREAHRRLAGADG